MQELRALAEVELWKVQCAQPDHLLRKCVAVLLAFLRECFQRMDVGEQITRLFLGQGNTVSRVFKMLCQSFIDGFPPSQVE